MYKKEVQEPASWRILLLLKRPELWWFVGSLAVLGVLLWSASKPLAYLFEQAANVRVFVHSFGPWAPLAYIGLFAFQILVAPFPGQFLGVMGGYLFGILLGSLYSILGLTLGAGLALWLARRYGRPVLERFFDKEQIHSWERRLRMRSPVTWGLLFLFPVPDLAFYVAGLSRVPLRMLLPAVVAGRSVGLIFASIVGTLSDRLPPELVIIKWGILLGLGVIIYRNQRQVRLTILLAVRRLQRLKRHWFFSPR